MAGVRAAHYRQGGAQTGRDAGLELAEAVEQGIDGRALGQRHAEPAGAGRRGEPGSKSHLDVHCSPQRSARG